MKTTDRLFRYLVLNRETFAPEWPSLEWECLLKEMISELTEWELRFLSSRFVHEIQRADLLLVPVWTSGAHIDARVARQAKRAELITEIKFLSRSSLIFKFNPFEDDFWRKQRLAKKIILNGYDFLWSKITDKNKPLESLKSIYTFMYFYSSQRDTFQLWNTPDVWRVKAEQIELEKVIQLNLSTSADSDALRL